MTLVCLLYYLFKYDTSFSDSLSMIMRIIFAPIIYIHIKETYYNISTTDSYYYIEKLVKINLVVFCINQMFGLIGFGKNTYTVDAPGIKGFLFDGNAAAVMIFCIYVYYFITSKYKRMVSFFFVFLGILLGTKVSILSIVLYMILSKIILLKRLKKLIYLFFMPLLIFILFYIGYINHIFDYHLERISRLYSMFGKNMVAALLSGRNIDLANRFKYYKENISIRQIFFGYGYLSNMKIIEIDLFDTLFSYGLLIFLPILYFYGYTAYINRKNKKILLFNILYFVISITSGHVWFNTSSALFYGIINTQLARKNK